MKKFLTIILSLAILLNFAACKSGDDDSSSGGDTPTVTANPATDFEYHFDGDYTVIDKYVVNDLTVVIPEEIESKPVISIGREAFKASQITSVTIPDSVEIINFEAFAECDALTDVKFGNSVTYLGARSFYSCDALEKLELPRNLVYIDEEAVAKCKTLKELTVPKTLEIYYHAAFAENESLVTVKFEEGLEKIGGGAFIKCTALETLMIPSSVTHIQFDTFMNCNALKDVYFAGEKPDMSEAFRRSNKDEINMHYNAKDKVPTVTLERTAPNTFDSESRVNPAAHFIYSVDKGTGFLTIVQYLSSDETVFIPETIDGQPVEQIGPSAFMNTNIKMITFPKTVKEFVGYNAFIGCESLEGAYFKGDAPELKGGYIFGTTDKELVVYYDSGTSGWDDTPLREWYTLVPKN